ncbi:MAG TPA: TlpA disulfide reductase family protein [Bacteroidota bacterium]|nr:TlpA disulfide reductase family protein [Bacteroidota bacterium]
MKMMSILLCAFSILLAGCSKNTQPKQADQAPPPAAAAGAAGKVAELLSVTPRPPKAADFSWKDSSGATVTFDKFRGKVTLINFWATWCGPCKKELPDLVSLSQELAPQGVKFIGVSVDRAPNVADMVRSFCSEHGITYQVLLSNDDMEAAFGNPRAIPTTVLVDADGNIAKTIVGLQTKEQYAQAIAALLK